MSENLGNTSSNNPDTGDFETKPELTVIPVPPAVTNPYGLSTFDIEELRVFFKALAKADLPVYRIAVFNSEQRRHLAQFPDMFSEPFVDTRSPWNPKRILRTTGEMWRAYLNVTALTFEILGKHTKDKEKYAFNLSRIIENGVAFGIIVIMLRQSKNPKVLALLPNEDLTSGIYGNAGRHMIWGIPFDQHPASFPSVGSRSGIEEL